MLAEEMKRIMILLGDFASKTENGVEADLLKVR